MSAVEMVLERDTANDESAMVSAVFVPSGTQVNKEDLLFEIENSKVTQEHYAPSSGLLMHDLIVGGSVNFGIAIAYILGPGDAVPDRADAAVPVLAPAPAPAPSVYLPAIAKEPSVAKEPAAVVPVVKSRQQGEARFSMAASALLLKHGLFASQFDMDFVTAKDVLAHAKCQQEILSAAVASALPVHKAFAPSVSHKLSNSVPSSLPGSLPSQRKLAEIEALSHGAGETMLSVLGVSLGHVLVRRQPGDFLAGRITDLVLFEASRLMRKYPRLNAFYADGQVFLHESVHAGLAIDDGGRLMVYGLENADRVGLPELADGIADAVARYVGNELTAQELTRATFTVTDLSADELDFVLPLLPRGQSCILGITFSSQTGFRLFAGFDHRVTEGREVSAFLAELRQRLLSFSSPERKVVSASVCAFCDRSSTEAVMSTKEKGLLKIVGRDGEEVLCCGSCWNGW